MITDEFDLAIIARLLADGRATQADLGDAANLSGPAAGRRLRLLEERGLITGYQATVDRLVPGPVVRGHPVPRRVVTVNQEHVLHWFLLRMSVTSKRRTDLDQIDTVAGSDSAPSD